MDSQELHQLMIISTKQKQTVNNCHITHVHIIMLITIVCRQSDVNSNISLGTGIATNRKPFFTMGRNWWEGETRTLLVKSTLAGSDS